MLAVDPCGEPVSAPSGPAFPGPRLPGIRFEPAPAVATRILPRMDIPVFVGFAARGPVDEPRVVEDIDAFTAIFGGEVVLVWDARTGSPVRGQLRAAIRAFFRNGGRRCWVIRVADPARAPSDPLELPPIRPSAFFDPGLAGIASGRLLSEADAIRYQREPSRCLRGLHAVLGIEEASLLVVPDATLPTWGRQTVDELPDPEPEPEPPVVVDPKTFEACDDGPPAKPEPRVRRHRGEPSSFDLIWPPVEDAWSYEVDAVREPGRRRPRVPTPTDEPRFAVTGAVAGSHAYRVRAIGPGGIGAWSDWVRVPVDLTPSYELDASPDLATASEIHAEMLRVCAARGDLFAILSLPESVDPDGVLAHVARVRSAVTGAEGDLTGPAARDADPFAVLSYGALYHPWALIADSTDAEATGDRLAASARGRRSTSDLDPAVARPPDGSIAGLVADRANRRGAWIAPANVELHDVVGLARPLGDEELEELHHGQVNVVRRTPHGFRPLAAHTLSLDPALRPINVRRLLSLLRRLAVLHGVDYVFEPNDAAFRRRIQLGFEALLAELYERGAFAGGRASDAYRVVVGDPPNTAQSVDAGRLIVELKVAPSVPLEFLTVRLVRTGDRLAVEAA